MDLATFKANLSNPARPNLFQVQVAFPTGLAAVLGNVLQASGLLQFQCKAASIPQDTVGNVDLAYMGRKIPVPGDRTFETLALTVYNDEAFTIRRVLEAWMAAVQAHQVAGALAGFSDMTAQNTATVSVSQLDRTGAVVRTYDFLYAWPSNVAAIELNWENQNQVEEFGVTFHYAWWQNADTVVVDASTGLLGL